MLLEDEGGGRTDIYALYKIYCLSCVRAGGGGGGTDIYIPPPLVVTPTWPACHHGEQQQSITPYLIFVTGTTGGARGEKNCHVEKFVHITDCQVEKFST